MPLAIGMANSASEPLAVAAGVRRRRRPRVSGKAAAGRVLKAQLQALSPAALRAVAAVALAVAVAAAAMFYVRVTS
jgi:hypothetical protein